MENTQTNEKIIGIPRAMSFYNNYPFYFGFFTDLGIKIVLSDMTTKQTMSQGSALVVTETCLPIKVYIGHILNLLEKGVDKIFVPSIQSVAHKIYNCSKIRGLPDLVRNVIKKEIAAYFDITDENIIKRASKAGWRCYNNFFIMTKSGMSYKKAMNYALQGKIFIENQTKEYPISVALVSHGYNIYDERTSMKIIEKLEKMDVRVVTSLQLSNEQMDEGINTLGEHRYWANEYEMTGTAGHYLKDNRIDGIITLTAFGCGPDSLMVERIQRRAKHFGKPLLHLTIDEQTGEAGFITRLEAFVDMLFRKKRANIINKIDINERNGSYIPNTNFIETK